MDPELDGIDGPYVVEDRIYRVTKDNELTVTKVDAEEAIQVSVDNADRDRFSFSLRNDHELEAAHYPMPEQLIVIADIEGNFNGLSSFLRANEVIDDALNWSFGTGHLVLCGDLIDRGPHPTQVLWLVYKLEQEAADCGGKIHVILGNHEIMNFQGNVRYVLGKHIKVAMDISGKCEHHAVQFMYSSNTELGKWMRTKNVIEKIGDYLFVHAGVHPGILEFD